LGFRLRLFLKTFPSLDYFLFLPFLKMVFKFSPKNLFYIFCATYQVTNFLIAQLHWIGETQNLMASLIDLISEIVVGIIFYSIYVLLTLIYTGKCFRMINGIRF